MGVSARGRIAALLLAFVPGLAAPADGAVQRGEYVFHAAGCAACHTQPDDKGPALAGGRAFDTPFGVFYSPNITPHPQYGIGTWDADDLWLALTRGEGPGGIHYYPVFPYPSYARMRREDSDALFAYLASVTAQPLPNREHDLPWFLRWRFAARVWKWLFLDTTPFEPEPERSEQWNRGAYLVNALGHCGECHSPRNLAGKVQRDEHLIGNEAGPEGEPVPGIRADIEDAGLADWSVSEIVTYLGTGEDPDFDFAGGAMVDVIDENTSRLTDADRDAIAAYLKDLPPL